jgi:hypothetical protein
MSHPTMPHGEELRRALAWITDERRSRPGEKVVKLLEEAAVRFNLSPAQEEWLLRMLTAG